MNAAMYWKKRSWQLAGKAISRGIYRCRTENKLWGLSGLWRTCHLNKKLGEECTGRMMVMPHRSGNVIPTQN